MSDVVTTYMKALAEGNPIQNVSDLCRQAAVSRTTFYRQFESLEDLDARFLRLYFQATYAPRSPVSGLYHRLHAYLTGVLAAMAAEREFFAGILVHRRPAGYDHRWWDVVDEYFHAKVAGAGLWPTQPLWTFQLQLVLGVLHQSFVSGARDDAPGGLDTVKATLDFIWSGTEAFIDLSRGLPSQAERHFSQWAEHMVGRL